VQQDVRSYRLLRSFWLVALKPDYDADNLTSTRSLVASTGSLLVERVDIGLDGLDIRLRTEGLASLAADLRRKAAA
jgi:hypothetical protein